MSIVAFTHIRRAPYPSRRPSTHLHYFRPRLNSARFTIPRPQPTNMSPSYTTDNLDRAAHTQELWSRLARALLETPGHLNDDERKDYSARKSKRPSPSGAPSTSTVLQKAQVYSQEKLLRDLLWSISSMRNQPASWSQGEPEAGREAYLRAAALGFFSREYSSDAIKGSGMSAVEYDEARVGAASALFKDVCGLSDELNSKDRDKEHLAKLLLDRSDALWHSLNKYWREIE